MNLITDKAVPLQVHLLRWIIAILAGCLLAWITWFTLLLLVDTLWGGQQLRYSLEFESPRKLVMQMAGMITAGSWLTVPVIAGAGVIIGLIAPKLITRAMVCAATLSAILFLVLWGWQHFPWQQALVFSLALTVGLMGAWFVAVGVDRG